MASGEGDEAFPPASTTSQGVTNPSVAYPIVAVTALAASVLLAVLRVSGWGPFIGYLLAPLGVIIALVLVVKERNSNNGNMYFEQTLARRFLRLLTALALVSLAPASLHSLQIARQVTLWLQ
jgi:hypothetical protein